MLTKLSAEGCIIPVDIYVMLSNCCSYCLGVFNMVRWVWIDVLWTKSIVGACW